MLGFQLNLDAGSASAPVPGLVSTNKARLLDLMNRFTATKGYEMGTVAYRNGYIGELLTCGEESDDMISAHLTYDTSLSNKRANSVVLYTSAKEKGQLLVLELESSDE